MRKKRPDQLCSSILLGRGETSSRILQHRNMISTFHISRLIRPVSTSEINLQFIRIPRSRFQTRIRRQAPKDQIRNIPLSQLIIQIRVLERTTIT